MKSLFSLFEHYEDCRAAVDELLQEGFDEEDMNVIVEEEVAKTYLDVNLERVDVKVTEELGEGATGLDVLLGVERPVPVPRLGDVYAAGKIATILAKTAAAPDTGTLGATLVGPAAAELIHVVIAHMEAGSTWRTLERSVHIHPTFGEGLPSLARMFKE